MSRWEWLKAVGLGLVISSTIMAGGVGFVVFMTR